MTAAQAELEVCRRSAAFASEIAAAASTSHRCLLADERSTVQRSRAGNDGLVVESPGVVFRGRARLDFPIALTGRTCPAVCQLPLLHRMNTLPARPHDGHAERATQWAFDSLKGSVPNFVHGPSVPATDLTVLYRSRQPEAKGKPFPPLRSHQWGFASRAADAQRSAIRISRPPRDSSEIPAMQQLPNDRTRDRTMTNAEKIAAIQAWQADGRVQPLICRNESRHRKLEPCNDGGIVILRCRGLRLPTDIPSRHRAELFARAGARQAVGLGQIIVGVEAAIPLKPLS